MQCESYKQWWPELKKCPDKSWYKTISGARNAKTQYYNYYGWQHDEPFKCAICDGYHLQRIEPTETTSNKAQS